MKRKTKKLLKKIIIVAVFVIIGMVITGNTPQPIRDVIDKIIPKAKEEIAQLTGTEGIEKLKELYESYTSKTPQLSNETNTNSLEIPKTGNIVVKHKGYTLSYNDKYEQADWVAYTLTVDELNTKATGRTEDFREDPMVSSAHLEDYKNSGYDRGHLCPSADRTSSVELNSETFYLSNMSPQIHRFNAGLWLKAEDAVRDAARMFGKIYIVTGPIFTDDMDTIGSCCSIAVPKSFYKVILAIDDNNNVYTLGLICPQEYEKGNLPLYATTVDKVEEITGIDFFYLLDDNIENAVESSYNLSDWPSSFSK